MGNSLIYQPLTPGIFYAEALKKEGCTPGARTAIVFTTFNAPDVEDQILMICNEGSIYLDSGIANVQYNWSNGETGREILIASPGSYWVEITNPQGCMVVKKFQVTAVVKPEISEIVSEDKGITIITSYQGDFEYSLDGINYQKSNYFSPVKEEFIPPL